MEEIAAGLHARRCSTWPRRRTSSTRSTRSSAQFADALDDNRELQLFFFSPYFSAEKKEGWRGGRRRRPAFVNFLELLVEKHRMPVIFRIRRQYDDLWEEENKLLPVQVTSAIELDADDGRADRQRIGGQTDRKVELSSRVDPDILGGLVSGSATSILDASIRNRLEKLRKQVAQAWRQA